VTASFLLKLLNFTRRLSPDSSLARSISFSTATIILCNPSYPLLTSDHQSLDYSLLRTSSPQHPRQSRSPSPWQSIQRASPMEKCNYRNRSACSPHLLQSHILPMAGTPGSHYARQALSRRRFTSCWSKTSSPRTTKSRASFNFQPWI
jgi:hypothetical protein